MEQLSINSSWKSCIRNCAQYASKGIVDELECGVIVYWTQCALSFLNAFFLSSAVSNESDLCRRLEEIKAYVTKMQPTFPWVVFIEPELLPTDLHERLHEICLAAEFVHAADFKCMQTTSLLAPVRALPVTEVNFATSDQGLYDAMLLNMEAHNIDTTIAKNVIENHAFVADFNKEFCCVVSLNGKPVSTATTVLLDDCLYVKFVATSPQHQQQGYAEVAMRASIERALKISPCTKYGIVLHATEMGRPVYKRMGFKDISHVEMYVHGPTKPI